MGDLHSDGQERTLGVQEGCTVGEEVDGRADSVVDGVERLRGVLGLEMGFQVDLLVVDDLWRGLYARLVTFEY